MQITLIQVEIEEAIRRYVLNQINVREGMRIDIDLKATRGAEGYQAFIDIVENDAPASPRTVVAQPNVVAEAINEVTQEEPVKPTPRLGARRKAAVQPEAEPDPELQPEEKVPVAGAMTTGRDEEVVDKHDENDRAPVDVAEVAEVAEVAPIPTTAPRSLFGGLNRPSNS